MTKCIISFNNSSDRVQITDEIIESGGTVLRVFDNSVKITADLSDTVFDLFNNDPRITSILRDQIIIAQATFNITVNDNWGLDRIDQISNTLNGKYSTVRTGNDVDIYIFDSGIKYDHTEFSGRAMPLYDAVNEDAPYDNGADSNGHGTRVAAVAGGVQYGVAKSARLYSVKVLNSNGQGSSISVSEAADAVITDHQTKTSSRKSVANLSFVIPATDPIIDTAVNDMIEAGIVVCVAAGNYSADASNFSPANVADAITVGSIDKSTDFSNTSNYGPAIDIFAPGENILSAAPFETISSTITYQSTGYSLAGTIPANVAVKEVQIEVEEAFYKSLLKVFITDKFEPIVIINNNDMIKQGYQLTWVPGASDRVKLYNRTLSMNLQNLLSTITGKATLRIVLELASNSGEQLGSGTSVATSHVSGVCAQYLQEFPSKFNTKLEVQSVNDYIINIATKNTINNVPDNTTNTLLYAPWTTADKIEWQTSVGSVASLNEGETLSAFVSAIYFNPLGTQTTDLTYSVVSSSVFGGTTSVQVDSSTGELTWDGSPPTVNSNEVGDITIRATPTNLASVSGPVDRTFSITVLSVPNQPPTWINPAANADPARGHITQLPDATEDVVYTPFDLNATDPELATEVTSYTLISGSLPDGLLFDTATGIISGTPSSDTLISTTYTFVVRATDVLGAVSDRTFSIFLVAEEVSPVWTTSAGAISSAFVGVPYSYTLVATDPDGDSVFYNIVGGGLPLGLTLDYNTGEVLGTPVDAIDTYSFTVEATDTVLGTNRTFDIDLQAVTSNMSPIWTTPAGSLGELDEFSPSTFSLAAIDPDGDPLTFSLNLGPGEEFPPGLTLATTGVITGTANSVTDDTLYIFTVDVSDSVNPSVSRTFSITIKNVEGVLPPVWITPSGSLGEIWEFYYSTFAVEAYDTLGVSIGYTYVSGEMPAGLSVDYNTGYIIGIPGMVSTDVEYTFVIRASNGTFDVDREFSITVLDIISNNVTKVVAARVTGYDKQLVNNLIQDIFTSNNKTFLYRDGDPEFGIPEEFDIYMAQGIALYPDVYNYIVDGVGDPIDKIAEFTANDISPADIFYSVINNDVYKWLGPDEYIDSSYTGPLNIVKPLDPEDPDGGDRDIGGYHTETKVLLNDLAVYKAKDMYTGDHLYDVIVVNISDPQAGASFRPDLITYDSVSGLVTAEIPDGEADPGIAYPPEYDAPFQNTIMQEPIITHPEYDSGYDGTVLNNGTFVNSSPDDWTLAIPKNTESLNFITPNSLENMRLHIIEGYGGFTDDIEIMPLWMGSEQIDNDSSSILGWTPAIPVAYVTAGTGQNILNGLTTDQLNYLKGRTIIIDRHLISTTPILTPTTTFSDQCWGTPPVCNPGTRFYEIGGDDDPETTFDSSLTTLDINNAPFLDCTFDIDLTTFDSVGVPLFNKYIKFPPGDKYWQSVSNTILHQLKKKMPAIDTDS